MLIINEKQVSDILHEDNTRKLMEETLELVSLGEIKQTLRTALHLNANNVFGLMPCHIGAKNIFGAKLISVFPENGKKGLKSHQGSIVLFDGSTGEMLSIVDADAITAVRTAAVSAVATDLLARKDSSILSILGAGLQGRQHAKAICKIRNIKRIQIWDSHYEFAKKVARDLSMSLNIETVAFEYAKEAVFKADIVCTVTVLREPIIKRAWLSDGVHINAVGACTPDAREIDALTIKEAKVFADSRESALNESGDIIMPIKEDLIDKNHILAEIGEVIGGKHPGRSSSEEITLFESLGLASEDIVAANYVYETVKGDKSEVI
ncbi:ornithine cyclodeaminase family protein [Acidaminobacter sp. JC074]|uniref:ornithine cyclodeaminase family protein n=1 Tax=Acidaminobacter sp. JC074 TaxID=2530199 RepID=UPI001F1107F6|nr:ornithine cyclodeaminase family protein [Acidaminobacter sp. JC074]MCH4887051.1 ornithine cyclodeaminase family protein [Acidaminobacter sp. JC074]